MDYTKGPWIDNGNEIVAASNPKVGIGGFIKDEDNTLASAAPDMYEALKEMIIDLEAVIDAGDWFSNPDSLKMARAALTKAEGRQP